jgi:hypothetical protein
VLPFVPGSAFVRVRSGDLVLGERAISPNPPSVQMTSQNAGGSLTAPAEISWAGSDPDGDPLSYMLQYSSDGGQTWRVLLMDIHTTNVRLDSFAGLAGGSSSFFRVTANDGVNTATDTNDSAFSIPNSLPAALIHTPADGSVHPQGATLSFLGQGIDPEDKQLPGSQMGWTSDLDGALGTGSEIITDTLSAGLHKITLTVTDSAGQSDDYFIFVSIDPNVRIERPGQDERDQVTSIFNGQVPVRPADTPEASADNMLPIALGLAAVLVVGLGGYGLWRARRPKS